MPATVEPLLELLPKLMVAVAAAGSGGRASEQGNEGGGAGGAGGAGEVGGGRSLLLVLDSLDQLSPEEGAHRLLWLLQLASRTQSEAGKLQDEEGARARASRRAPVVRIVVSCLPGLAGMNLLFASLPRARFLPLQPLPPASSESILDEMLRADARRLSAAQRDCFLRACIGSPSCASPLFIRVTYRALFRDLPSFAPPPPLPGTARLAVRGLLLAWEERHGRNMVAMACGMLAVARDGLTSSELEDALSLNEEVLLDVLQ